MKKTFLCITILMVLMLSACSGIQNTEPAVTGEKIETTDNKQEIQELRAVWLSYSEISEMAKGKTETEYRENASFAIGKIADSGLNTVFFQARAFSDAFYSSEIFPVSKYILNDGNEDISYDVLKIFIECAKERNISVHAWVNPFRVSTTDDFSLLDEKSPAIKMYAENKASLLVCEKGIYYNPASSEARALILNGIREIINNYDVDGIHFDDYFYPVCEKIGDESLYKEYVKTGGLLSVSQWRCENINNFIASVYSLVKSKSEKLAFGISPSADVEYNKEKLFADVKMWCDDKTVDYIMPQIYFGFENETKPFTATAEVWEKLLKNCDVTLYCGLAAYKCGKPDKNAGSGQNEWEENSDILIRQYEYLSGDYLWSGFSLFSYSYSFGDKADSMEMNSLLNDINKE